MMQNRQPISAAARWNSRASGPQLPTAKNSLRIGTGVLRELEEMTKMLNLGTPSYKLAGGTGSGRGYFCSVNIGGHYAGSLDEYVTTEQAQCAAALNAMNLLKTYYADTLASHNIKREDSLESNDKSKAIGVVDDTLKEAETDKKAEPRTERIVSDDFERVVENLLILLENMPRGIYSHALATKYSETYKQNLPPDWISKIKDGYPEFVVDEVDSFRSIIAKRRHVKSAPKLVADGADLLAKFSPDSPTIPAAVESGIPGSTTTTAQEMAVVPPQYLPKSEEVATNEVATKPEISVEKETEKVAEEQEITHDSRRVVVRFSDAISEQVFTRQEGEDEEIIQPPPVLQPPAFCLPDDNDRWHVFVSVVKTPADFTVRILGEEYSEQYEQLQIDMQEFYETKDMGVKLVVPSALTNTMSSNNNNNESTLIGHVFAAKAEECWHRVYLNEIIPADEGIADEGITASVYFIDHGDYETLPFDDLRVLEQQFMRLPCQATSACLVGFEKLSVQDLNQEVIDRFRDLALGKILPAQFVGTSAAEPGELGRLLLLLAMPVSVSAASAEGGNENATANGGDSNNPQKSLPSANDQSSTAPIPALINELIVQMMPKSSIAKLASARIPTETLNGNVGVDSK